MKIIVKEIESCDQCLHRNYNACYIKGKILSQKELEKDFPSWCPLEDVIKEEK